MLRETVWKKTRCFSYPPRRSRSAGTSVGIPPPARSASTTASCSVLGMTLSPDLRPGRCRGIFVGGGVGARRFAGPKSIPVAKGRRPTWRAVEGSRMTDPNGDSQEILDTDLARG